jgi:predicted PurR-regulated permease PerM
VLPRPLLISTAACWRFLVITAALYLLGRAVADLAAVVVPIAIAVLLAALLSPALDRLIRRGVPRAAATAAVLIGALAVLGGLLIFVVISFVHGVPGLSSQLASTIDSITTWLATGPPHLSAHQLANVRANLRTALNTHQRTLTTGALTTAATIGKSLTQLLLVLFTLAVLLHGGADMWRLLLRTVPERVRGRVEIAGRHSLGALTSYVRATAAVAVVDTSAIGLGLAILGVPLAVPISALVFLGAFVPILGTVAMGGIAVLVALIAKGVVSALILLGVVIAVIQLESHIVQPLLLARAVKLHPLAIVLVIATGLLIAGIAGALLAVPLLAVLNSAIRSLRDTSAALLNPADVDTPQPEDIAPAEPALDTHTAGAAPRGEPSQTAPPRTPDIARCDERTVAD